MIAVHESELRPIGDDFPNPNDHFSEVAVRSL